MATAVSRQQDTHRRMVRVMCRGSGDQRTSTFSGPRPTRPSMPIRIQDPKAKRIFVILHARAGTARPPGARRASRDEDASAPSARTVRVPAVLIIKGGPGKHSLGEKIQNPTRAIPPPPRIPPQTDPNQAKPHKDLEPPLTGAGSTERAWRVARARPLIERGRAHATHHAPRAQIK